MTYVLCRLPNHVGDCCMCLPALRLLEASGYTPCLVGKRWAGDLMSGMNWRFDPIEGHVTEDYGRIRHIVKNTKATKGLVFPNSFGSALLFRIGRLKTTGLNTDARGILLEHKIPEPGKMHEAERFFYVAHEAIKAWGGKPAWDHVPQSLGLGVLKRHEAAAKNLIQQHGIPEKFVLLAPIARGTSSDGKTKHWPHFNALCKPLRELGYEPIIFPAVREEDAVRQACPDATILPPTTLGNYAAIAKKARLVIANDSGISHLAAALGLPQITLFGVTPTEKAYPWNPYATVLGSEGQWPDVDTVVAKMTEMLQ